VLSNGLAAGSRWEQFHYYRAFVSILHVSARTLCSPERPHGGSETIEVVRAAAPLRSTELLGPLGALSNILMGWIIGWSDSSPFWPSVAVPVSS
jgi:hypothetical protein